MTKQSNADLIAEAREGIRVAVANGWAREGDAPTLAMRLAERLEAAEQDRNQLAAVIEKAEDYVTRHYLDTRFGDEVLPMLSTDPAGALREVKAEAWDEGAGDMAEHIDNGSWWEIQNPYQGGSHEHSG